MGIRLREQNVTRLHVGAIPSVPSEDWRGVEGKRIDNEYAVVVYPSTPRLFCLWPRKEEPSKR